MGTFLHPLGQPLPPLYFLPVNWILTVVNFLAGCGSLSPGLRLVRTRIS